MLSPYGENKCEAKTPVGMGRTPTGHPCSAPTPPPLPPVQSFKRPVLNNTEYEDAVHQDNTPSQLLYDYTTLEAWYGYRFHHCMKKFYFILFFFKGNCQKLFTYFFRLNYPVKRFKPQTHPSPVFQPVFKQEPVRFIQFNDDH